MTNKSRRLRRLSKFQEIQEAPDGGWGWVLVVGGMLAVANWSAATRCFSVFYVPLKRDYSTDYASVAWINGLYQIGYGVACVLVHFWIQRFGYRRVCMASGIMACVTIFIGSWATQLLQIQILAGLIPGICMANVGICCMTIVTRYFKKRLNLATQFICTGMTVGALVYCPVYQWLIGYFGWRGAFQIIAGFFLNIAVVGALMRPLVLREDFDPGFLEQYKMSLTEKSKTTKNINTDPDTCCEQETSASEDFQFCENSKPNIVKYETNKERLTAFCKRVHLDIYTQPLFYLYTFGWVTFAMAYFSSLTYLVPFGINTVNLTAMQSSYLVSAMMTGEIISRILLGITFDRICTSKKIIFSGMACLVMAATFLLLSSLRNYYALLFSCVLLGLCGGGMDGIYSVFIVDFFGLKLYAAVYGYSNIITHSVGMATTVLTGKCVDATGKLESAFFIGSAAAVLSFFLCLLMRKFYLKLKFDDNIIKSVAQ